MIHACQIAADIPVSSSHWHTGKRVCGEGGRGKERKKEKKKGKKKERKRERERKRKRGYCNNVSYLDQIEPDQSFMSSIQTDEANLPYRNLQYLYSSSPGTVWYGNLGSRPYVIRGDFFFLSFFLSFFLRIYARSSLGRYPMLCTVLECSMILPALEYHNYDNVTTSTGTVQCSCNTHGVMDDLSECGS